MTIIQTLEPVWKPEKDLSHKNFFFQEQYGNKLPPIPQPSVPTINVISFYNGVIKDHLPLNKF